MNQTTPPHEPITITAKSGDADTRLDVLLANHLDISRREAQHLIKVRGVTLQSDPGLKLSKATRVQSGWQLAVTALPDRKAALPVPQADAPLDMLAQDDGCVIVNKPQGMPVHPLEADETGTVLNAVIARYPQIAHLGEGGLRSGVLHRLDTLTSGTLAFAKTQARWEELRHAFATHQTTKIYHAIVQGKIAPTGSEKMDLYVARHKPAHVRVVRKKQTPPSGARECDLSWECLRTFGRASLVEISLGTGFLHQIRVMFNQLGHPVLGDPIYRNDAVHNPVHADELMLHASVLKLPGIEATAPQPARFDAMLAELGA